MPFTQVDILTSSSLFLLVIIGCSGGRNQYVSSEKYKMEIAAKNETYEAVRSSLPEPDVTLRLEYENIKALSTW